MEVGTALSADWRRPSRSEVRIGEGWGSGQELSVIKKGSINFRFNRRTSKSPHNEQHVVWGTSESAVYCRHHVVGIALACGDIGREDFIDSC